MKHTGKLLAGIALLVAASGAQAQQTRLLTADKHNEYGLIYVLPTTAIRFDVTAERTVRKAGPYWKYAKKYIGTDKVIKEDSESWTITDVKAVPYGVPDSDNKYLMQLKSGALTYICVDENGMLLSINKEVDAPEIPEPESSGRGAKKHHDMRDYLQYVNEDFIASQSSAKQAQMLAESIMEIRDARISLTRGTAETMPTDGRQLELMLNSLQDQEAAMTAAFCGLAEKETVTRSYTYIPEEDGREVLFRLSDFAGFVEKDDLSGSPVYVKVEVINQATLPQDAKGEDKKIPKDAVIYCVPGTAQITLSTDGKTLYDDELEMAQFGVLFGLNPTLFSVKKNRSFAVFDPVTGGLKEIGEDAGE